MLVLVCLFCWTLWMGTISVSVMFIGILLSLLLRFTLAKGLAYTTKLDRMLCKGLLPAMGWLLCLLKSIFLSNLRLIPHILSLKKEPKSCIIQLNPKFKSPVTGLILSNAVTLTPGTLTLQIQDGTLWIHALDKSFVEGMEDDPLFFNLKKLEKKVLCHGSKCMDFENGLDLFPDCPACSSHHDRQRKKTYP